MAIAPTAPKGLEALLPRTPANDPASVCGGSHRSRFPARGPVSLPTRSTRRTAAGMKSVPGCRRFFRPAPQKSCFFRATRTLISALSPEVSMLPDPRVSTMLDSSLGGSVLPGTSQIGNLLNAHQPATACCRGLFLTGLAGHKKTVTITAQRTFCSLPSKRTPNAPRSGTYSRRNQAE